MSLAWLEFRSLWRSQGWATLLAMVGFWALLELACPDFGGAQNAELAFVPSSLRVAAMLAIALAPVGLILRPGTLRSGAGIQGALAFGKAGGVFFYGLCSVLAPIVIYTVYRKAGQSEQWTNHRDPWTALAATALDLLSLLAIVSAAAPGLDALRQRSSSLLALCAWATFLALSCGVMGIGVPWPLDRVPGPDPLSMTRAPEFRALAVACLATFSAAAFSWSLLRGGESAMKDDS